MNYQHVRQSIMKLLIPEIAKLIDSISADLVEQHNQQFQGSPLI